MKHIIFGGDGFVGRVLAAKLVSEGHEVLVADIAKGAWPAATRQRRRGRCIGERRRHGLWFGCWGWFGHWRGLLLGC
ncbi:MAG: hypothetical protein AAFO68_11295, partial [Pseudomonadota bacterium]